MNSNQSPLDAVAARALGDAENTGDAIIVAPEVPSGPTFADLGLSTEIVSALVATGYTAPTGVQARAIPAALAGRDLLVSSPTGSGKTAAFMLPAIELFAAFQRDGGKRWTGSPAASAVTTADGRPRR